MVGPPHEKAQRHARIQEDNRPVMEIFEDMISHANMIKTQSQPSAQAELQAQEAEEELREFNSIAKKSYGIDDVPITMDDIQPLIQEKVQAQEQASMPAPTADISIAPSKPDDVEIIVDDLHSQLSSLDSLYEAQIN